MRSILKAYLVNTVLFFKSARDMHLLRRASRYPKYSQMLTLKDILGKSKDTVYGREHHFEEILAAGSDSAMLELFRKYNKPVEYEDMRPYVNRMKKGEADVLFPGKAVMYATTSGSTGEPKYIPISQTYMDDVYKGMTKMMLFAFTRMRRKTFSGNVFSIVGKTVEGHTEDGTVTGSVSGLTNKRSSKFVGGFVAPFEVYGIEDYGARNYTLMRFAIEKDCTLWGTPNPSTILELQHTVDQHLDLMIEDIGKGTLNAGFPIEDRIRKELERHLKPNPGRAFELRKLQNNNEHVLPRHYWPHLQLVCSWKCGNTQVYLKKMSGFFNPQVLHMEMGYFSSECRAGLVLDDSIESVLMPHMHFYEFKREKDMNDPDAPFYRLGELKEGERYCQYVTTASGLYRYNLNDIVQVASPYYRTSRIHMVQKVNGIVSITGEKLYEEQFIKAVDMAQESTGKKLCYYTGYVNLQESRYDWYFEFTDKSINQRSAEEFAKVVDSNLKRLNIEYESKRDSFRLKEPAVFLLVPNAFDKFKQYILNRNHRDASRFKPNILAQNEENHSIIHRFILSRKK